jgi:hypothetical protein
MKKIIFRLSIILPMFTISSASCFSQEGSPLTSKMNDLDQFRNSRDKYTYEISYLVNGQAVLGSPFFYNTWLPGSVKTKGGGVFENYELNYDVFHQALFFKYGKDSLEVTDEINEFTLASPSCTYHFINSKNLSQDKLKGFYQVVLDDSIGQLLIYNLKRVSDETFGIPVFRGKKHFEPKATYYYYNKKSKKIDKINANGSNITSVLGISKQGAEQIKLSEYNLSEEVQLVDFFHKYFEYTRKVGAG